MCSIFDDALIGVNCEIVRSAYWRRVGIPVFFVGAGDMRPRSQCSVILVFLSVQLDAAKPSVNCK